ncbi:MAG: class I SAM-dependent methyltransferase [Acidimicrobiia bacterium]|nr:class I SAM-dependent methyltransferase [Acidimicrobiia bacterium]
MNAPIAVAEEAVENTSGETTETEPVWVEAGRAWGHAAIDWAYRFEPYGADAIEAVFGRLGVDRGTDLLDMACGSGFAAGRAGRLGATVSGLDASAALIDIARRRAPSAELVAGDMFDLPWADGSFDAVTSFNGIWGGCTDALAEARRVLRPGGGVGLTFWGRGDRLDMRDWFIALGSSTPQVGEEMISLASIGSPGVVEEMLTTAGFGDVERWDAPSILEFADEDDAWRALRSPGLVVPALAAVGEDELRNRLLPTIERFRAADGSYRIVNELTCVVAWAT